MIKSCISGQSRQFNITYSGVDGRIKTGFFIFSLIFFAGTPFKIPLIWGSSSLPFFGSESFFAYSLRLISTGCYSLKDTDWGFYFIFYTAFIAACTFGDVTGETKSQLFGSYLFIMPWRKTFFPLNFPTIGENNEESFLSYETVSGFSAC